VYIGYLAKFSLPKFCQVAVIPVRNRALNKHEDSRHYAKSTMKNFMLGFITALLVPAGLLYFLLEQGHMDLRADIIPSRIEAWIAMGAVDASAQRHGPKGENPLPASEANLMAGLKLYRDNCSICHGEPSNHKGKLDGPVYPPVTKFTEDMPMDMSESQDFYIIKHGIRFSGMPGWGNKLSDDEIWKLSSFLKHMGSLPPAVDQEWEKNSTDENPEMEQDFHNHMHH
jgi:mono/diheme cytochrome c family protein